MYPGASARLLEAVGQSGHVAIGGLDLELADGTTRALRLVDGSVTEDAWATERWTLDATVTDDGLTPLDLGSPLFPGAVLRPWRGVQHSDGSQERVSLGALLSGAPEADLDEGTIAVRGEGRSTAVSLARLIDPWPIEAGSLLSHVVSDLLADRLPGCPPVRLECDDVTLAETFIPAGADSDPWQALTSTSQETPGLIHSAGRRLWFDADGVPVLQDLSAPRPPFSLDGSTLTIGARASIDPARTYGAVCVTSNALGDDAPLTAVRYDPSPVSQMFAKRVYFAQLDALTTQDALAAAAESLLARVSGIAGQASWEMPPNPALQAGDVVTITGGPLEGTFEIARITTPLREGLQQIEAVERAL